MQTEQRPMSSKSAQKHSLSGVQDTPPEMGAITGNRIPARLPPHSRAAAAQRLNDVPEHTPRGIYYEGLHQPLNPSGWRTKRHIKRKNLRFTNEQVASIDRMSIHTMLTISSSCAYMLISTWGLRLFFDM